jgi:hypothetical protein
MDGHVADVEYTDGVWRPVHQDAQGRQYVIDGTGAPVLGVWVIPEDQARPCVIVDRTGGF